MTVPADGYLSVELVDSRACAGCHCGRLAEPAARAIRLDLEPASVVRRGDELAIAMPGRELLRAALWVHGLPWLALVAGSAAGGLAGGDVGCVLGAGVGMTAALGALRRTRRRRDDLAAAALRFSRTSCAS